MAELEELAKVVTLSWSKNVHPNDKSATLPEGVRSTGIWWADRMKELLGKILEGGSRYKNARDKFLVRAPGFERNDKPWAGIIMGGSENEKTGKYRGDSFVIFPSDNGGSVVTLALGSLGPGEDVEYLSRAELARNIKAITDYINIEIREGSSCAWSKSTPARTDINELPMDCCVCRDQDELLTKVLTEYKNDIYIAVNMSGFEEKQAEEVLVLLLDQFLLSHGCGLRSGLESTKKYRKYIFPSQDERSILERLKIRKYIIIEGPPGTGKTRLCRLLADLKDNKGTKFFEKTWKVQFHPNMTYEQFIGGLYPEMDGGAATFKPKEGVLLEAIARLINRRIVTKTFYYI